MNKYSKELLKHIKNKTYSDDLLEPMVNRYSNNILEDIEEIIRICLDLNDLYVVEFLSRSEKFNDAYCSHYGGDGFIYELKYYLPVLSLVNKDVSKFTKYLFMLNFLEVVCVFRELMNKYYSLLFDTDENFRISILKVVVAYIYGMGYDFSNTYYIRMYIDTMAKSKVSKERHLANLLKQSYLG